MSRSAQLTDLQRVLLSAASAREDGALLPAPAGIAANKGTLGIVLKSLLARGLIREQSGAFGDSVWRLDEEQGRIGLVITPEGLRAIGIEPEPGELQRKGNGPADPLGLGQSPDGSQKGDGTSSGPIAIPASGERASPDSPKTGAGLKDITAGGLSAADQASASVPHGSRSATAGGLARGETKLARLIAALRAPEGATIAELTEATGWQAHSVRGAISGNLKKKLNLTVVSEVTENRGRVYRISDGEAAR
jgi:hypothetical protein